MEPVGYLFLACAGMAALLGLIVVIHALMIFRAQRLGKIESGPQVDLHFLKFKIKGGRPFAIFIIGVLLIIFPMKYSANILTPSRETKGTNLVPDPSKYDETDSLPEATLEGFMVSKDIRIIDLRSRISIPDDKRDERYSPVTWTRYTLLSKLSNDKSHLNFEFSTSGVDLNARCLTHEYKLTKLTKPDVHGSIKLKTRWQIEVDVSDVSLNTEFLVLNEVTYWNAFRTEDEEWAGMNVLQEVDVIGIILLFPPDKPFKNYTLYAYKHGTNDKKVFRGKSIIIPSENNQVLLWKVEKPIVGFTYQINWTW